MSSENAKAKQSPEELSEESLKSIAGGSQGTNATDSNPPTEVPSPSERTLDPSSAKQSPSY